MSVLYMIGLLSGICCLGLTEKTDFTSPTFTNCPSQKIVTQDRNYVLPTLQATDNSGSTPTITKVKGPNPPYPLGASIFEFKATDGAGNSYSCVFMLEVQAPDCSAPTSEDPDVKFTCNGHTHGSACQLSCKSGTYVVGDSYIQCVTGTSSSAWKSVSGAVGKCYKRPCPALAPPTNGAVVCETAAGGSVCQMMCERSRDISRPDKFIKLYHCITDNTTTSMWVPSNDVQGCLAFKGSRMHMPNKYFYFDGTCQSAVDQIKQNFISNLGGMATLVCGGECTNDEFKVRCGGVENSDDSLWTR